ncbi:hypothetical protein BC827DRAFT_1241814 [Russula dissimulans]|nr:hypothetical protein BC827DRAFT_1241814 [Russula dissimulans]
MSVRLKKKKNYMGPGAASYDEQSIARCSCHANAPSPRQADACSCFRTHHGSHLGQRNMEFFETARELGWWECDDEKVSTERFRARPG